MWFASHQLHSEAHCRSKLNQVDVVPDHSLKRLLVSEYVRRASTDGSMGEREGESEIVKEEGGRKSFFLKRNISILKIYHNS